MDRVSQKPKIINYYSTKNSSTQILLGYESTILEKIEDQIRERIFSLQESSLEELKRNSRGKKGIKHELIIIYCCWINEKHKPDILKARYAKIIKHGQNNAFFFFFLTYLLYHQYLSSEEFKWLFNKDKTCCLFLNFSRESSHVKRFPMSSIWKLQTS